MYKPVWSVYLPWPQRMHSSNVVWPGVANHFPIGQSVHEFLVASWVAKPTLPLTQGKHVKSSEAEGLSGAILASRSPYWPCGQSLPSDRWVSERERERERRKKKKERSIKKKKCYRGSKSRMCTTRDRSHLNRILTVANGCPFSLVVVESSKAVCTRSLTILIVVFSFWATVAWFFRRVRFEIKSW